VVLDNTFLTSATISRTKIAPGEPARMEKKIVVLDTDEQHCQALCAMLEEMQYRATPMPSVDSMKKYLQGSTCLAVIVDIEHASVDNRTIRNLSINYPGVYFFGMSTQHYNPTLREAICYHIYVCLNKPVDSDELYYLLRSINENDADSKNQPES
jgi:DNA-binding NtrC family response regulator